MSRTHAKYCIFYSLVVLCFLQLTANAQSYRISVELPALRDSQLLVASYYFGSVYVKDTLHLDANGRALFTGNEPLPEGIYQLYLNPEKQYDFLVGSDQHFRIALPSGTNQLLLEGAVESEKFQSYIDYLTGQKEKLRTWTARERQLAQQPDSQKVIRAEISELDTQVKAFQNNEAQKNKDNLYGKILLVNKKTELTDAEIPAAWQVSDSLKWVYQYNYRKTHYWDNFDLGDLAMWHTPFVKEKLNEYFNRVVLQSPDSVLPEAVRLIETYRNNPELFQNLTSYLANNAIQSKIMGMENVFVALAERYYLSGQATWADKKTLDNIRTEVAFRKYNLVGNQAPDLVLENENGEYQSLYQSPTPYTLIAFWEPDCSHCKKEIPLLYDEIFENSKPSQLSIYAIYTMTDKKEWIDFIAEHQLNGWINAWDPNQLSDMKILYGVRTTPSLFLIDKNKHIIAKQLDVPGMKQFLQSCGALK